jgi:hypothetical protein
VAARAKSTPLEGNMFEELEQEEKEQKQERKRLVEMTSYIVAALVVVIAIGYLVAGHHAKTPQNAKATAAAANKPAPDPVMDLHIIKANMGKDPWGTSTKWSVQLHNTSKFYTYKDVRYDAYFLDPKGVRVGEEHNTIKDSSLDPGEEKEFPEFTGGNYDSRGSTYQFVIAGATVAQ